MADNNYAGNVLTMESFTAQTTDGSGDITVTLQNAPVADDAIIVNLQGVAGAFAQFKSRTTTAVTFTVFQKYDKTTGVDGTTAHLTDLPAGITEQNAKVSTDTFTGSNAGNGVNSSIGSTGHSHGVSHSYTHGHDLMEQSATALSTLNSTGSITLVVTYAF